MIKDLYEKNYRGRLSNCAYRSQKKKSLLDTVHYQGRIKYIIDREDKNTPGRDNGKFKDINACH